MVITRQKSKMTPPANTTPEGATRLSVDMSDLRAMIPAQFNGDKNSLLDFLQDCNSAIEMCAEHQKIYLYKYILTRLTSNVRAQLRDKSFNSWESLKTILLSTYNPKKRFHTTDGRTQHFQTVCR